MCEYWSRGSAVGVLGMELDFWMMRQKYGWMDFWGGVKNPAWVSVFDFLRTPYPWVCTNKAPQHVLCARDR